MRLYLRLPAVHRAPTSNLLHFNRRRRCKGVPSGGALPGPLCCPSGAEVAVRGSTDHHVPWASHVLSLSNGRLWVGCGATLPGSLQKFAL